MKIYSIILYILIFNLVCGFTGTAISTGLWLGDDIAASNVIVLPYDERLTESINQFYESSSSINLDDSQSSVANFINNVGASLTALASLIGALFVLINSCITFIPTLFGLYFGLPDFFVSIISVLMYLVSGIALFQLISGRYFTMVE